MTPEQTRALTLAGCLRRLQLEHDHRVGCNDATLTVHLIGADHREGNAVDETYAAFLHVFELLASDGGVRTLRLVLVGPNIARPLHNTSGSRVCAVEGGELTVEMSYYVGSFDAFHGDEGRYSAPDLAVCFNAGIWGYDEWLPTLRLLLHTVKVPLLVTSYNENEASDDEDVLDTFAPVRWFWRPEKNPSGAAMRRRTDNDLGSELRENDFWMCLGPAIGA